MNTLKEKYPVTFEKLALAGYTGVAGLMDTVASGSDLDRLLGTNGSASNWMTQKYLPNSAIEAKAKKILADQKIRGEELLREDKAEREFHDVPSYVGEERFTLPVEKPAVLVGKTNEIKEAKDDVDMFLVFVPSHKTDRVMRVLELLGVVMEDI